MLVPPLQAPGTSSALVESDAASDASPREVITMCLEGDFSAFDEARRARSRRSSRPVSTPRCQRSRSASAVARSPAASPRRSAQADAASRVEVDGDGWAKYSDDSASAGSSTEDDATSTGSGSTLDSIDSSLTELIGTKYWPLSIEQTDVEVIWKGEGSVVLVISLPEPAALLLHMLATQKLQPLIDLGVRCVKFGALVVRLDDRDDMPKRVERLHAVEKEAAAAIDRVRRQADAAAAPRVGGGGARRRGR